MKIRFASPAALLIALLCLATTVADDFDDPPISYRETSPNNLVTRLEAKLKQGTVGLHPNATSYMLADFLREFNVPVSSQVLVFSKTSLQRHKIRPDAPRSIYFNDDIYIGFCQDSPILEVSAVDPQLGTAFYTLDMVEPLHPRFERQSDNCLICHASSHTRHVPGHMVRSVYTDAAGLPLLSMGSQRVDHSTPFSKRWGGWYVTGTHGTQTHLGNLTLADATEPEAVKNEQGQNRESLASYFDTTGFLSPHSDIVALMVLEHQAEGHNLIIRASFQTRQAIYQQDQLNKELKQSPDYQWDSTKSRIRAVCEDLVKYLLFCDEAKLTHEVKGNTSYAADFMALGPRDTRGRSLRDFDLRSRMFRYPCSYLIYTDAFQQLPDAALKQVWQRLDAVLSGHDRTDTFKHLSDEDRQAIRDILLATHPQAKTFLTSSFQPTLEIK